MLWQGIRTTFRRASNLRFTTVSSFDGSNGYNTRHIFNVKQMTHTFLTQAELESPEQRRRPTFASTDFRLFCWRRSSWKGLKQSRHELICQREGTRPTLSFCKVLGDLALLQGSFARTGIQSSTMKLETAAYFFQEAYEVVNQFLVTANSEVLAAHPIPQELEERAVYTQNIRLNDAGQWQDMCYDCLRKRMVLRIRSEAEVNIASLELVHEPREVLAFQRELHSLARASQFVRLGWRPRRFQGRAVFLSLVLLPSWPRPPWNSGECAREEANGKSSF